MADVCDLEPFRYRSVPVPDGVTGASSNQINEQSLEQYLARLVSILCTDLTAIETRLTDIEARLDILEGTSP